ncbi:hypothetical protein SteCoe_30355 [Stentor coeruleus]|uniref:Secreted protein n=1 Tax=Stentor coeruleus TaxID=5963 RepID=A0A1R2B3Y3_9CILI|nr:hypothetical protein SteCoe_30355 [Stentor coeruleus]
MVFKLLVVLFPIIIVTQSRNHNANTEDNEPNQQNLINCLADTVVLESILFNIALDFSTGVKIPEAINQLKTFWDLLPPWFDTCKGIVNTPEGFEGEFPELDMDIQVTEEGIIIDGQLYTPEEILEKTDYNNCLNALEAVVQKIVELKQAIESKDHQKIANLVNYFKGLNQTLINNCRK